MNRYQTHIDKAEAMGGARLITEVHVFATYTEYFVTGSRGDIYSVFVDDKHGYVCGCPAGQVGRCCYHCGAVYLRRLADSIHLEPVSVPAPALAGIVCPSCSGTIDPLTGRCVTGYLFGDCDYRPMSVAA